MVPKNSCKPRMIAFVLCVIAHEAWIPTVRAASDPSFVLAATADSLADYFPGYLANGYVSTFSSPRGTEGSMAHLVAFMDYAGDDFSRPAAVPGFTEIDYSTGLTDTGQQWLNKVRMDGDHFQDYHQVLDLHDATLTTRYRYRDGTKHTAIEVTTLVSQAAPHLAASRFAITPDFDGMVQLSFAFNLWAEHAPRLPLGKMTGPEMEEAVAAHGLALQPIPPATADRAAVWYPGYTQVTQSDADTKTLSLWLSGQAEQGLSMAEAAAVDLPAGLKPENVTVYKSRYRLALNLSVRLEKGRTYVFTKYVALSRQGWGGDATEDLRLAKGARADGFERLMQDHQAAWHRLWQTDLLIDGDPLAQRAVHSELYYLLASTAPDTAWPLGACAITTGYAGHAFWDSDTWIFPALLLLHPERAKSLAMFRARTLAPAQARAQQHGFAGAMFPWESDPEYGTEQTPHFAAVLGDREIHVNADVAIAQWQYFLATQDIDWLRRHGWPVIRDVARFWVSRATYVPSGHRYEILHVTSVDEPFADVPNDTFTNASAAKALSIATRAAELVGEQPDPRWQEISRQMYLPLAADGTHHVEFDPSVLVPGEGPGGGVPLFVLFPSLDLPMSKEMRRQDYAHAVRTTPATQPIGNSMGYAPLSIAAAAAGKSDDAAAWFQRNFDGTMKAPFNVRTETATNNTGYFLTASGAYLQNLIYGFSGLRIQEQGLLQAYPPLLPDSWKSLTLRNITFRGQRLTIRIARDAKGQVQLTRAVADAARALPERNLDFEVREGLNINRFVRDDKVAAHLLLRSGADPRIIMAFPAGNSGVGLWFSHLPKTADWEITREPQPIVLSDARGRALYGLTTEARIGASELTILKTVLSSVRVLRDYQGLGTAPDLVDTRPVIQGQSLTWARDRLDGAAGYRLTLEVIDGSVHETGQRGHRISAGNDGKIGIKITGASGEIPLTPLYGNSLLNDSAATDLTARHVLTFLSYKEKYLAGSWRFNTYFGRDTLMSVRLLMPVLNPQAIDAGLGSVLGRLSPLGEVAHEESIGEFAILDHLRADGSKSDAPILDYKMIDGTFMLAPVARAWLLDDSRGRQRAAAFLAVADEGATGQGARRGEELVANLRRVLNSAAPFSQDPRWSNLVGIKGGFNVGNWRDSNEGLGRGLYPYDVNAVLVPAALAAASRFLERGLLDPYLRAEDRTLFGRASAMAKVWSERAPPLFEVRVPHAAAARAIGSYATLAGVAASPGLTAQGPDEVRFHGISIDARGAAIPVMNSDEGFALLFAEPDAENLTQLVIPLVRPFPAGLMTEVGMLVANPVYAAPEVQERFNRNAYHGTVVWSWQQALFAAGLDRQLARTDIPGPVRAQLQKAQQDLWRAIDATRAINNSELWSWSIVQGQYRIAPFGVAGADADESNAAQLWSTVYLAVHAPASSH